MPPAVAVRFKTKQKQESIRRGAWLPWRDVLFLHCLPLVCAAIVCVCKYVLPCDFTMSFPTSVSLGQRYSLLNPCATGCIHVFQTKNKTEHIGRGLWFPWRVASCPALSPVGVRGDRTCMCVCMYACTYVCLSAWLYDAYSTFVLCRATLFIIKSLCHLLYLHV